MTWEAWVHNPERVMGYTEALVHGCFFWVSGCDSTGRVLFGLHTAVAFFFFFFFGRGSLGLFWSGAAAGLISFFSVLQRGSRDRTTSQPVVGLASGFDKDAGFNRGGVVADTLWRFFF